MLCSLSTAHRISLTILLAIGALHARPLQADFVLVQDGQPRAAVVIPDQPTASVTAADSALRSIVYQMTGVQLTRYYEKNYTGQLPAILVGQSNLAQQAGVNIPQNKDTVDRYVIRVTDQQIVLAGNDAGDFRGSCFAVYDLLWRLGCRWYGPDALWRIIPSQSTLTAPATSVDEWPAFLMRSNWIVNNLDQTVKDAWHVGGWGIDASHAMDRWLPRSVYYAEHPDWFGPGQPCVTHPEVIAFFVNKFRTEIDKKTGLVSLSLSANDNEGFCTCSRCLSVGNPSARWLYFANAIARELAQSHPNRYLLPFYAFRGTHPPPSPSFPAEPGVCVVDCNQGNHLCPLSDYRNSWEVWNFTQWKSIGSILGVYEWWIPNISNHPDWKYAPWYSGETSLDNLRYWKRQDCRYLDYQTGGENSSGFPINGFPLRWPLFYVGARGMWDPEITAKEIMAQACTDLYGQAAEPMRRFYQIIEDAMAACTSYVDFWHLPDPQEVYSPEVEWQAIECTNRAEALADNADALRRIQQEGLSMQYLKLARGPDAVGLRYGPLLDQYELIAQREGMSYPSTWRSDWNNYAQWVVTNSMPSDGATAVWPFAWLQWSPPTAGATSYQVYFGTTNPPPLVASTTDTFYDPGFLVPDKVYYWRTDPVSGGVTTATDVRTFTTRQAPTYIDLGGSDEEQGVRRVIAADGNTVPVAIGGVDARRNQNQSVDQYMYFNVDDCYACQGSQPDLYITVSYFDTGSGSLSLEYDSSSNAYRSGGSIAMTTTATWRQYTFHVTDAYFGNRQTGGADFRISAGANTIFYLDTVVLHRQPGLPGLSEPLIADGRVGVDESATLSWTPATDATCYRVYFGAADPPSYQATVTGTTFAPGTMDYLRTWYWRIDPVNDYGVTTGPVWRFVTRTKEDRDSDGDIDQSDFGYFQACLSGRAIPQNNPACVWAKMDADNDVDVSDLDLLLARLTGPGLPVVGPAPEQTGPTVNAGPDQQIVLPASAQLDATVSDDGFPKPPGVVSVAWTQQSGPGSVTFGDAHAVDTTASFDQPGIYALRLTGSDSLLTAYDELTVTVVPAPTPPERAISPVPADQATGLATSTDLAWSAGTGAASHNVYFGPTYPPAYQGNQAGMTFDPGELSPNTTYYWRIDEVNNARATSGNVWTFTTGSP